MVTHSVFLLAGLLLALIFFATRSNAAADGKEPSKIAHAATSGPVQAWVALYNGPANSFDNAKAMAVDGAGNVYVTGTTDATGNFDFDYATVKYDASGTQQWVATYNGTGNGTDHAYAIAVDGSGNVYVTGTSLGTSSNYDYATIKYDASGTQQWVARYNGTGNGIDTPTALAVDSSGNVYVTGFSGGSGSGNDYATIKYDTAGTQLWATCYNGPGNGEDLANALAIDGSGNVYVTGASFGSDSDSDYATIKYDAAGTQQWAARYNGPGNGYDSATAIAVDNLGNTYVTGTSFGSRRTDSDYATIKYDAAGTQQWAARYNGPGNGYDQASAIAVDSAGDIHVAGSSIGSGTDNDYATVKYDATGTEEWVARYNGPGNDSDVASSMALDGSGNTYVTGFTLNTPVDSDCATVKYDPTGAQEWVVTYGGPAKDSDGANAIVADSSGNIYVTGYSVGVTSDSDYLTIKYVQTTGFACPVPATRWEEKPGQWPVDSLTLGSESYNQRELLAILRPQDRPDASLLLARQLIAAKLNLANGSDPAPVMGTVDDADALLSQFSGKLPYHVKRSSTTGMAMRQDVEVLVDYNHGKLTPDCGP
jgi:hypothetical protein